MSISIYSGAFGKTMKKYLLIFTAILGSLISFSSAHAATFVFSNNGACPGTNTCSYNTTIPSLGSQGYAIVYVLGYHNSGNLITSVSLGGHAMTKVNEETIQNANQDEWSTWVLQNPPIGSQTITTNFSGTITYIIPYDTYWSGVTSLDATSSLPSALTNTGTACTYHTSPSVTYVCWDGTITTSNANDTIVSGARFDSATPASSLVQTIVDSTNFGNNMAVWASSTLTGAAGTFNVEVGGDPATNYAGISTLALTGNAPPNPPLPSLYFPGNSTASSSIPDFTNWLAQLSGDYSNNGTINILYAQSTSTLATTPFVDSANIGNYQFGVSLPIKIIKSHSLWFPPLPYPATWYAEPEYRDPSGLTFLGSIQKFTVIPASGQTIPSFVGSSSTQPQLNIDLNTQSSALNPSTTATSSPFFVDCSNYQFIQSYSFSFPVLGTTTIPFLAPDFIPGYFCQLWKFTAGGIGWAIIPPTGAIQGLTNSFTQFQNVLPLNIIFGVANVINLPGEFEVGSSTQPVNPNIQMNIPDLNGGTTGSIELVGTSTLKNDFTNPHCDSTCAQGHVNDIGTWTSVTIWIGAFASIYKLFF